MKLLLVGGLFLLSLPAFGAWERVCAFEGAGLGSVSFLDVRLLRQPRSNGNFDYMIQVPVGVAAKCITPQYPVGKVSVTFYMTGGTVFETGKITRYHNGNDIKHVIKDKPYLECLDSEWSWEYDCKF